MSDIRLFLSWAHNDAEAKDSILKLLKPRLRIAKNHVFTWWEDSFILPGEEWKAEILTQLAASDFIRDYEIPGVGDAPLKKTLPVMLVDVPLDGTVEFHQIDRRQIYRGNSIEPHSYVSRETDYQRDQFVGGFFSRIIDRVEGKGGYR